MIANFFSRPVEFDIQPMRTDHCLEAAAIHGSRFVRAWGEDEIDALLSQTNVHGFVIREAVAWRSPMAGFVMARFAADEAEILTIAVRQRLGNRGLGWRLMLAAIRQMRNDGAQRLFLEVDETNAPAIALYRKLGFEKVAERKAYYRQGDGARTAALVMRLDLL